MTRRIGIAGLEPDELAMVRLLVSLLRHPDPSVGELTRQALNYVKDTSSRGALGEPPALGSAS